MRNSLRTNRRTLRSGCTAAAACIVALALISGCATTADSSADDAEDAAGNEDGAVVEQLNEAAAELDDAVDAYLELAPPSDPTTDLSTPAWDRWFEDGFELVEDIERAFDRWATLLDEAPMTPPPAVVDLREAISVWVTDLRQQAELSRQCARRPSREEQQDCYVDFLEEHGDRWKQSLETLFDRVDAAASVG